MWRQEEMGEKLSRLGPACKHSEAVTVRGSLPPCVLTTEVGLQLLVHCLPGLLGHRI